MVQSKILIALLVATLAYFTQAQSTAPAVVYVQNQPNYVVGDTKSIISTLKSPASSPLLVIRVNQPLFGQNIEIPADVLSLKDTRYYPSIDLDLVNDLSAQDTLSFDDLSSALSAFQTNQAQGSYNSIVLTSSQGSYNQVNHLRKKRQLSSGETEQTNSTVYIYGESCAAMFDRVYVINSNGTSGTGPTTDLVVDENASNTMFTCSMNSNVSTLQVSFNGPNSYVKNIVLDYHLHSRTWNMRNASVTINDGTKFGLVYLGPTFGMDTPTTYSFACTRTNMVFYSLTVATQSQLKVVLYLENFQIQPFNMNGTVTETTNTFTFGQINYCQGYFTLGIWMGVTASLLLGFILACGVSFLSSIKTMDRFDDPKGKQLTIALEK